MSFTLTIKPEWNMIQQIKEYINSEPLIAAQGSDFREATLLTAIELVENGLKYSDGEPPGPVLFIFDIEGDCVKIQVSNSSHDHSHKEALRTTLARIKAGDPFDLYVERLEQIRANPDGFSRMGLVRIVYEGEYQLESDLDESEKIIVTARRSLQDPVQN